MEHSGELRDIWQDNGIVKKIPGIRTMLNFLKQIRMSVIFTGLSTGRENLSCDLMNTIQIQNGTVGLYISFSSYVRLGEGIICRGTRAQCIILWSKLNHNNGVRYNGSSYLKAKQNGK